MEPTELEGLTAVTRGVSIYCPKEFASTNFAWDMDDVYEWYKMMQQDGTLQQFFHILHPSRVNFDLFYSIVSSGPILPFFGVKNSKPALFFMMEDIQGATARIHFVLSKSLFGAEGVMVSQECLAMLFNLKRPDGNNLFSCFLGETPIDNQLAIRFAKHCGFEQYGVISEGFYIERDATFVDKVLTKVNRQSLAKQIKKVKVQDGRK